MGFIQGDVAEDALGNNKSMSSWGIQVHEIPKHIRTISSLSLLPRRRLMENKNVLYLGAPECTELEQGLLNTVTSRYYRPIPPALRESNPKKLHSARE